MNTLIMTHLVLAVLAYLAALAVLAAAIPAGAGA